MSKFNTSAIKASITAVALSAVAVQAQLVIFNIDGTFGAPMDPNGTLSALGIALGTPYTGQVSYDAALSGPDQLAVPTERGRYGFPAGAVSFTLSVSGHVFSSDLTDSNHQILTYDQAVGNDALQFTFTSTKLDGGAPAGAVPASSMFFSLVDSTRTALSSDALPTTPPSVAQYPSLRNITLTGYNSVGDIQWEAGANVKTITPVPEPAETAAITGASLIAFAAWARQKKVTHRNLL